MTHTNRTTDVHENTPPTESEPHRAVSVPSVASQETSSVPKPVITTLVLEKPVQGTNHALISAPVDLPKADRMPPLACLGFMVLGAVMLDIGQRVKNHVVGMK